MFVYSRECVWLEEQMSEVEDLKLVHTMFHINEMKLVWTVFLQMNAIQYMVYICEWIMICGLG